MSSFPHARLIRSDLTINPHNTSTTRHNYSYNFTKFIIAAAAKGLTNYTGMSEVKKYLHHFGYLETQTPRHYNFTDTFDELPLETAVLNHQKKFGLNITGKLDSATVKQMMLPRCGVSDDDHDSAAAHGHEKQLHVVGTKRYYSYFLTKKWTESSPVILAYAFSTNHMVDYIDLDEIKSVFHRAFQRWADVVPIMFKEADQEDATPDIRIGFYRGDHGDGYPFDGALGTLAHASGTEVHFDGDETWSVDFNLEKSRRAIDLESVVIHEIGHVLGLGHSWDKNAVMYPTVKPRTKKVHFSADDVAGIQSLYGAPNPDFIPSSRANGVSDQGRGRTSVIGWVATCMVFLVFLWY